MGTTAEQGFVFSFDLLLAFLAMLLMAWLMVLQIDVEKRSALEAVSEMSFQRKAVFLADSMVKNRNEEQPLLGSALFDFGKNRVLPNHLDLGLLAKAKGFWLGSFFVSGLKVSGQGLLFQEPSDNCMALERLVFVQGKEEILEVLLCEE